MFVVDGGLRSEVLVSLQVECKLVISALFVKTPFVLAGDNNTVCQKHLSCNPNLKTRYQKPGDDTIFVKQAIGVRRPISELWEFWGILGATLRIQKVIDMENPIPAMVSRDFSNPPQFF